MGHTSEQDQNLDVFLPELQNYNYKHVVSLGSQCFTSTSLQRLKLRLYATPFDWMLTSIPFVTKCIESNFVHFLNPDYLEKKEWNGRTEYKNNFYPSYWGVNFTHHDPISAEGQRYFRRSIERFDWLLSSNARTLFILVFESPQITPNDVAAGMLLNDLISTKTQNSKLVIVSTRQSIERQAFEEVKSFPKGGGIYLFQSASKLRGTNFVDTTDDDAFDKFLLSLLDS
jgi:hypothetical protein